MSTNNSRYTKEFKENAVRLAFSSEKSRASVARDLGVPEWKLREWVRTADRTSGTKSNANEVLVLHKELKKLRLENEILKKAAAFFARDLT